MASKELTRRPLLDVDLAFADPFAGLADMRARFDRIFEEFAGRAGQAPWLPALDVQRTDDALRLRVDVPGMEPGDVKVEITDGVLTVSGEHAEEREHEHAGYLRRERRSGGFRRAVRLPKEAQADAVTATVRNGVAEIVVPLAAERAQTIEITPTAG